FLDLRKHGVARKVADGDEQAVRGRVVAPVKFLELVASVRCDLLFGRRDDSVGMLAEEDAAEAFAGEKAGCGPLDFQLFELLPTLALEFAFRKGGLASEVGNELEKAGGKFRKAGDGDGARVRSGASGKVGAHAAQVLLDLAARPRSGPRANNAGGDIS